MPMIMLWIQKLVVGLLLSISMYASASDPNQELPLRWGYYDFPPRLVTDDKGKPKGELALVVDSLMKELKIPYQPLQYPNRRFVKLMEEQQIDFSLMVKYTFTDPEKVIFSDLAIGIVELRVYWLAEQTAAITQRNDLFDKSLIVIAAFSYGGLLQEAPFNQQTHTVVENHQRALEALRLGRGQYLLDYRKPFELATLQDNVAGIDYVTLQQIPVYMVIRADLPNAQQLMKQLETTYKKLFPALYKTYNN